MFAVLGDLEFDALGWQSHDIKSGVDWAQHGRIGGKPRLEPVASRLTQIQLRLAFHRYFDDPAYQADRLRRARDGREPMALVFATGEYLGRFVITDLEERPKTALDNGDWLEAEFGVSLLEYEGPDLDVVPPAVRDPRAPVRSVYALSSDARGASLAGLGVPAGLGNVLFGGSSLGALSSAAAGYLSAARGGLSLASSALSALQRIKTNPIAALGGLVSAATPLAQAVPALQGLGTVLGQASPWLPDAVGLASQATNAARSASIAWSAVRSGGLGGVAARIDAAAGIVSGLDGALATLRKPVAQMALSHVLRLGG